MRNSRLVLFTLKSRDTRTGSTGKNCRRADADRPQPPALEQAAQCPTTREVSHGGHDTPTAQSPPADGAVAQHETGATPTSAWRDPRYQAFALMRLAFTVAPIAFGLDKFFNVMVHWPAYLASWIDDITPGTGQQFMYFVGVTEILAGVIVALKPRYGAYVVAAWLVGIIFNLLTYSGFYDIALRDFGLMLGALTLARLASVYDPPLELGRR
jgi:uncharacterized membrane protein YphA (DoxX/SURF4 family)